MKGLIFIASLVSVLSFVCQTGLAIPVHVNRGVSIAGEVGRLNNGGRDDIDCLSRRGKEEEAEEARRLKFSNRHTAMVNGGLYSATEKGKKRAPATKEPWQHPDSVKHGSDSDSDSDSDSPHKPSWKVPVMNPQDAYARGHALNPIPGYTPPSLPVRHLPAPRPRMTSTPAGPRLRVGSPPHQIPPALNIPVPVHNAAQLPDTHHTHGTPHHDPAHHDHSHQGQTGAVHPPHHDATHDSHGHQQHQSTPVPLAHQPPQGLTRVGRPMGPRKQGSQPHGQSRSTS